MELEGGDERPSTTLGTSGGGSAWQEAPGDCGRIHANKNRVVQLARTGGRKLFDEGRKELFLEWFAATCNVSLSAAQAGINYKTAFRHRMNDERFAEAWDRALDQGVARLKAKLLETKATEPRIGIEGDLDAPEMGDVDPAIAVQMLREHERRAAGYPKRGRSPRVASTAEVEEALVKALKAYGVRVMGEGGAPACEALTPSSPSELGEAPPPCSARSPSPSELGEELG